MTIGIAILGTGEMGLKYAEALARYTTGTRFVAVAVGSRAAGMADQYGVSASTLDEILRRDDVDAVVIATPHSTHVPIATACAAAGKHIYIEKPLARTVAECDEILAACDRAGVRLTVNTVTRFRPSPIAAKRLLDDGAIGALRMIRVLSSAVGYEPSYKSWTSDPSEGGIWLDWGCHGCDALRWLTGSDATEAFGFATDFAGPPALDRSVMAQFTFRSGVAAQLLMSFEMPPPGLGSASQWTLIGSTGIIELDGYSTVKLGGADGWKVVANQLPFDFDREPLAPHLIAGFATQLQDFIDAVTEGREPIVTGRDGRASVEMVEAARRSSREHRSIALPLS